MADTHKYIDEEIEVTLKLKVKFNQVSFYGERTDEELSLEMESVKKEIEMVLYQKICDEYFGEELGDEKSGYMLYYYVVDKQNTNTSNK